MSNRAARRAAERQAKAARPTPAAPVSEPQTSPAVAPAPISNIAAAAPESSQPSAARLAANRANAQHSSGPKSTLGKATSSLNAVKTALTGRTVVLHSDDVAEYQRHILAYETEFQPVGFFECDLTQSIADTVWRLRRISNLEQTLFAKGRLDFAEQFANADPSQRASLIELHTYEAYNKQLRNLQLQEARLARRREKEIAEFRNLQQERIRKHNDSLTEAARLYLASQHDGKSWSPQDNGFEFSIAAIQAFLETLRTNRIAHQAVLASYSQPKASAMAA